MNAICVDRVSRMQERMSAMSIDIAVIADADSIYYFSGFANYLAMDFGRATILVVTSKDEPILITPSQ
ncbi:MAG: aminopeptidase P family N-terminal domain-containing protein, partial [Gemmatimonadales bacterium]